VKGYKTYKAAEKWSVRKWGDDYQLVKKVWDGSTGEAGADSVTTVRLDECTRQISQFDSQIANITTEKEDWELLKTDLSAL
tara:strand:+ start:416 stop:658 length:243 start_codon:yes stop_codon:yes gene_type:complete